MFTVKEHWNQMFVKLKLILEHSCSILTDCKGHFVDECCARALPYRFSSACGSILQQSKNQPIVNLSQMINLEVFIEVEAVSSKATDSNRTSIWHCFSLVLYLIYFQWFFCICCAEEHKTNIYFSLQHFCVLIAGNPLQGKLPLQQSKRWCFADRL